MSKQDKKSALDIDNEALDVDIQEPTLESEPTQDLVVDSEENLEEPLEKAKPKGRVKRYALQDEAELGIGVAAGQQPPEDIQSKYLGSAYVNTLMKHCALADRKKLRIAYLKYKRECKWTWEDYPIWEVIDSDYYARAILDRLTVAYESEYINYMQFPYKGFVYKRAVKLVIDNTGQYVAPSNDVDIYGICVDIDEYNDLAIVCPITEPFEGYLRANYGDAITKNILLDFNVNGDVVKSAGVNKPTAIKIMSEEDAYNIDLRTLEERVDASFVPAKDFIVSYVKVRIEGRVGNIIR